MLPNQEELEYIAEIFNQSYDIPVFVVDKEGHILFESASNFVKNPLIQSKEETLQNWLTQTMRTTFQFYV